MCAASRGMSREIRFQMSGYRIHTPAPPAQSAAWRGPARRAPALASPDGDAVVNCQSLPFVEAVGSWLSSCSAGTGGQKVHRNYYRAFRGDQNGSS